jgi:hypothetical protein
VKYKYETGQGVWVVLGADVKFGIVMEKYQDRHGKSVYDVRVVGPHDDPVEVVAGAVGSETACGWSEHRVFSAKGAAAVELYHMWADRLIKLKHIMRDGIQFFGEPDNLIKHLAQIESCNFKDD